MKSIKNLRKNSDEVFGKTFKRYSKKEIIEFIHPFKIRFKKNRLAPRQHLREKLC